MLNPINLGATFSLAKIQEEYILSSRELWKYGGNVSDKKPYEEPVDSTNKDAKDFKFLKRIFLHRWMKRK